MTGGVALNGEVTIAGAKNAALPILCASLLTADPIELFNVPDLQDVRTMLKLLQQMRDLEVPKSERSQPFDLAGGDYFKS